MNPLQVLKRTNYCIPLLCTLAKQGIKSLFGLQLESKYAYKPNSTDRFVHRIPINELAPQIDDIDSLTVACNHYLRHEFDLLGSGYVCMNTHNAIAGGNDYVEIDWQRDIRSGFCFTSTERSKAIAGMEIPEGVDIKGPWELSRLQHLPQLALAATADLKQREVYCKEILLELKDFISNNPVGYGVNWVCTMDVALRAVSILIAYDIIGQISEPNTDMEQLVIRSMNEHAVFIAKNLEKNFTEDKSGNHYLSDLLGLLCIGHYIDSKRLKRLFGFAEKEYKLEIMKQYLPDGGTYEYSTAYQRLDNEITALAVAIMLAEGTQISDSITDRLSRASDIMCAFKGEDGRIVQIGDNDSGHAIVLQPLTAELSLSADAAIEMLGALFIDNNALCSIEASMIRCLSGGNCIKYLATENENEINYNVYESDVATNTKATKIDIGPISIDAIKYFPWFGLVVYHGPRFNLYFRPPIDLKYGKLTHIHNDFLHFEIVFNGLRLFADPGSYLYTSNTTMRELFRSDKAHNIPKYKVSQIESKGCWKVKNKAIGRLVKLNTTHACAYMTLEGIVHVREIKLLNDGVIVVDKSNTQFLSQIGEFEYESNGYGRIGSNHIAQSTKYPLIHEVRL